MSIFSIIHEIPVGARFPISQDQISRIQEEALALETRIAELEAANLAMREAFTEIAEDIPVDCPWYMESIAEVCATILAAENK